VVAEGRPEESLLEDPGYALSPSISHASVARVPANVTYALRTAWALAFAVPESPMTQMRVGIAVPTSGCVWKKNVLSPPARVSVAVPTE
jgi:hypothetical protein